MGLGESAAVAIFLPIALVSVPVGLTAGLAVDRRPVRQLVVVMSVAQILMSACMAGFGDPVLRTAAIVGWGAATGFYGPLTAAAMPNFFGRTHLGAIQGAMMSCVVIGSALGPSALAALRDGLGSYAPALLWLTLLPVGVLVAAPFVADPARPER